MPKYIPIIGIEIHVELKTKSKMFCSCANDPFIDTPNTHICEICLAHPGTLPVPNKTAIEWTVKIARALKCIIRESSKFDRKHYFYPDLPKGYQISQYDEPVGERGFIELDLSDTTNHRPTAKIGITRVHLEEDTAKLSHDIRGNTLVDFNRAGVPLVEIVSEPDIQSSIEAKRYCEELQLVFRTLGISNAEMEKGQMRCEANISLQEEGKFTIENGVVKPLGEYILNSKVEVKNINSFKAVEKAIEYEIKRQTELLEMNQEWLPETRGWDENQGATLHQRTKESAADYRYFPEPDIPPFNPLMIAGEFSLPELPQNKRKRFCEEYGFSKADAYFLSSNEAWAEYAEQVMSELIEWIHSMPENKTTTDDIAQNKKQQLARLAGGWITTKLVGAMAERKIDIRILKLKPENFAELITLVYTNRVNSTNAQKILSDMLDNNTDYDPTHIMEEKGYGQISDEKQLISIIEQTIDAYPEQVQQFKSGKEPILKFLIGMIMKATEGSADPKVVEKLFREKLK